MDDDKAALLGELATEAGVERASFLTDAGGQFSKFLEDNAEQIQDLGGLVLIDDDPEYLAIEADGTFKSRTRFQDDDGEWVSEDETIESGAELIEIYNPADLYAAFADAARAEAGLDEQPTTDEDSLETAGAASEVGVDQEDSEPADEGPAEPVAAPDDKEGAARLLYDLSLSFQERSQRSQANLLDDFRDESGDLAAVVGSNKVLDEEDERLWYRADGSFEAEVLPERDEEDDQEETAEPAWQALTTPDDMVQFYDPTDLFGDLAEAIAEEHPGVAPELDDDAQK